MPNDRFPRRPSGVWVLSDSFGMEQEQSSLVAQAESLRATGVVVLEGVLSTKEVEEARDALDRVFANGPNSALDAPGYSIDSGAAGEAIDTLPDGSRFATNLLSKHPYFLRLIEREPVISLVRSLMSSPLLSSMNTLEPLLGTGHQTLHRDEGPIGHEGVVSVNTLWVLDDMDESNGATRYLPGTHLTSELASDDDPRTEYASVPSGSVIVMNAHMLHGASTNHTGRRRRVVHVYYTRQGRRTQTDWSRYVPKAVRQSMTQSQRKLLGFS